MTTPLDPADITKIQGYDPDQRYRYLLEEVVANREIWILTDEHGCVMFTTEDEDCVPVWPNREFAQAWATGEWEACQAVAISLNKWHSRWTPGLADDELAVVIFPNEAQDGLIVSPEELDFELKRRGNRGR